MISQITDCVLDELGDWQNRPLKRMYTFLFVDCMYVTIGKEYESKNYAVYTILGYDTKGLWCTEPCSCLKSLWAVLSGVVTVSRGCWCMETKFQPCWATFRLRQCCSQGYVHYECCWEYQFQFQKGHQKGAFPTENALLKLLYLRITELYKKWNGSKVQNWAMVQNQLATNDKIKARIEKYEHLIWRCFCPPFSFRYAPLQRRTKNINYLTS